MSQDPLFDEVRVMPDPVAASKLDMLVGLDHLKSTMLKEARLVIDPGLLAKWSKDKHGSILPCLEQFHERSHLVVFYGDVGTGKTTLADSMGDPVAREQGISVTLFRLSLATRGQGRVGQMTGLISQAFDKVIQRVKPGSAGEKSGAGAVFVIDEADALAESRETDQMHHEDRAGVNALIRGIDRLARERLPVLVILCTNRNDSLDPAILRRAAISHEFTRPDEVQRMTLFRRAFGDIFDDEQYGKLVRMTGFEQSGQSGPEKPPRTGTRGPNRPVRPHGYSFSDITQRLIPNIVLEAFPDDRVSFDTALSVLTRTSPRTSPRRSPSTWSRAR